jgi:hypothetical protein
MFIVWGTTIRRRTKGFGLHFCPICRDLRACAVKAVEKVGHVYYLPVGRPEQLHLELTCPTCKSLLTGNVGTVTPHKARIEDPYAALDQLLPDEASPLRARLAIEEQLDQVSPDQRRALLAEPIMALNYEHDVQSKTGWRQSLISLLQLMLVVAMISTFLCWGLWCRPALLGDKRPTILAVSIVGSALTGALLVLVLWVNFTAARRLASGRFIPRIAQTLRVLVPAANELEATKAALSARGFKLAESVDLQALQRAIEIPTEQRLAA